MTPEERLHFTARVVQDAMTAGTAIYWRRRAATFDWARPRPGDYAGHSTAADQRARDERLAALAASCRAHAEVLDQEWRGAAA